MSNGALTVADLLTRGLFHDHIVPPLGSAALQHAMQDLLHHADTDFQNSGNVKHAPQRTRCTRHSVPKRKLARKVLSIPNPRNQALLAIEVERNWPELQELCQRSSLSLTSPVLSGRRSLQGSYDRRSEAIERAKRSVGYRYVLHADISRFYPSIYTHSIPWAIHGQSQARSDKKNLLYGNRLDLWLRETQDKQTGGIPVGPDTSFLLAEVIASSIDFELQNAVRGIVGTRYIDDYYLYCMSAGEAEKALAELHRIASQYELEVNDLKTGISELPEALEPRWKTDLRAITVSCDDHATSFKAIFDRAAELAREFPQDSIFTYLVKKIETVLFKSSLPELDWKVLDALLLRAAVGEPSCLPTILRIFERNNRCPPGTDRALNNICSHHAGLQQASEVAWALWSAKRLEIRLSQDAANAVEKVDDDIVALVALDLHYSHLLPKPTDQFSLWSEHMTEESLYSEHWLLAYEALGQDWLPSASGMNYVQAEPYFGLLHKHSVRFYDTSANVQAPESGYSDEDEDTDLNFNDDVDEDATEISSSEMPF